MNEASPSNMIRSYTYGCLSNSPCKYKQPANNDGDAYLADVSGCPVLPDEMQQIVFTIVEDDRTLLGFGVNEI